MAEESDKTLGIDKPKDEWADAPREPKPPMEILKPKSKEHQRVLEYLLARIKASERKMAQFYDRWQVNEKKLQAYIDLPDWEQELQDLNEKGKPPHNVRVVIPFSYATISTIVTFLLHTFTGRKPIFQVGTYKEETAESSRMMETVLQYNADNTRIIKHLFQFLQDTQVFGVGIMKTMWRDARAKRTVVRSRPKTPSLGGLTGGIKDLFGGLLGGEAEESQESEDATDALDSGMRRERVREERTVYQGNEVEAIDPYMFFPDPRVPMREVNKRGEFVFWRFFEGRHHLLRQQKKGNLQHVDTVNTELPRNEAAIANSDRALRAEGDGHPDTELEGTNNSFMQVDQGTVEIIPRELGLGDSETPEKWVFTIVNKSQIVQAEPFNADHGMHPVAVAEPYAMGQSFGSIGMSDFLGPLQDIISWLVNSHQDNVRKVINDQLIVDPSAVEMQDLKDPGAGRLVRLKRKAYGRDVRTVVHQLQVTDVTANHIKDMQTFIQIGQQLSAVSENVLGLQSSGGRKTATEVRTSSEAAASRLASQARIISAQALVDLSEQMAVNNQQYLTDDFYLNVVGREGVEKPLHISPEHIVGDFYYPTHDGTLPLDRVAMLDIWQQLFQTVTQDQELRQAYSIPRMFEFIAELGGARNIENMRLDVQPDNAVQQMRQQQGPQRPQGPQGQGGPTPARPGGTTQGDAQPRSGQPAGVQELIESSLS